MALERREMSTIPVPDPSFGRQDFTGDLKHFTFRLNDPVPLTGRR
jgi:hypothetical protein